VSKKGAAAFKALKTVKRVGGRAIVKAHWQGRRSV
jgi:hypothetical protein